MTRRGVLAAAVWTLAGVVVLIGVVTATIRVLSPDVSTGLVETSDPLIFGAYCLIGALLISRQPRNPVGWLLGAAGVGLVLVHATDAYAQVAYAVSPPVLPFALVAAWMSSWMWGLGLAAIPFLLMLFPDGRLPSPRWRPVAWILGIAAALLVTLNPAYTWTLRDPLHGIPTELPPGPWTVVLIGSSVTLIIGVVVGGASLLLRYRTADGVVRRQLKWLALAVALVMAAATAGFTGELLDDSTAHFVGVDILGTLGFLGIPIAIGVAVLRYRLYEIDRIVSRTVSYGVLTLLLVGVYVVGVVGLGGILRSAGGGSGSDLVVAASTLAVAAVFQPLRRRVGSLVDRRFDRSRYDAQRTVETFAQRLREEVDLDPLIEEVRAATTSTLRPASTSVWLSARGVRR